MALHRIARIAPVLVAIAVIMAVSSTAEAASRPCPTTGRALYKQRERVVSGQRIPQLRVSVLDRTLWSCFRARGKPRVLRRLGPWSVDSRVVVDHGQIAWTTRRLEDGLPVDGLSALDPRTGRRWLEADDAVPAADAATPAAPDRVLRLLVTDHAAAWVTANGTVAIALSKQREGSIVDGVVGLADRSVAPYRTGLTWFLHAFGPAQAQAIADKLRFTVDGDGDECDWESFAVLTTAVAGTNRSGPLEYAYEHWTGSDPNCG
jgi:hypothetical protein